MKEMEDKKKDLVESEVLGCCKYLKEVLKLDSCFIAVTYQENGNCYAYYDSYGKNYASMNILRDVIDDERALHSFED